MTEPHLKEDTAILDEFSALRPPKSKLFDALIISSLFYIGLVLLDFAVDFKTFSLKNFDWQLAIVILVLPLLGIIFHLTSKKIGWIINTLYYLFISLVASYTFLRSLLNEKNITIEMNWRGLFIFILAL